MSKLDKIHTWINVIGFALSFNIALLFPLGWAFGYLPMEIGLIGGCIVGLCFLVLVLNKYLWGKVVKDHE